MGAFMFVLALYGAFAELVAYARRDRFAGLDLAAAHRVSSHSRGQTATDRWRPIGARVCGATQFPWIIVARDSAAMHACMYALVACGPGPHVV